MDPAVADCREADSAGTSEPKRWRSPNEVCVSAHRPVERRSINIRYRTRCDFSEPVFDRSKEAVRHERAINSLRERSGASLAEIRSLFTQEFGRLEQDAKVRSYLAVLTASNVRAMLRRKDRQSSKIVMLHDTSESQSTR